MRLFTVPPFHQWRLWRYFLVTFLIWVTFLVTLSYAGFLRMMLFLCWAEENAFYFHGFWGFSCFFFAQLSFSMSYNFNVWFDWMDGSWHFLWTAPDNLIANWWPQTSCHISHSLASVVDQIIHFEEILTSWANLGSFAWSIFKHYKYYWC